MIVLDAGALIGLENNDRRIWADLKAATLSGIPILVPLAALAQVWRGSPRQTILGRALDSCETASFDELATEAGRLCGEARTGDVVDASVAITAARSNASHLYTSDPRDLRHLLATLDAQDVRIVAC